MLKVAFITASSSGFGFAIALDLSKRGYTIILNGRDEESLSKAKEKLYNKSQHHTFCCDLVSENMEFLLDLFFTKNEVLPNVIIHSLGGTLKNDKHPINADVLHKTMQLNINASIAINNYFIKTFKSLDTIQKIIHISSSASLNAKASPAYSMSKSALNTYVKSAARYYAKNNILVCAIIPNIIMHEGSDWMEKQVNNPEYFEKRIQEMPLKEFSKPEDLTPYISSICEINSMYATGSLIELQGGV